jgi:hypothetical protein
MDINKRISELQNQIRTVIDKRTQCLNDAEMLLREALSIDGAIKELTNLKSSDEKDKKSK